MKKRTSLNSTKQQSRATENLSSITICPREPTHTQNSADNSGSPIYVEYFNLTREYQLRYGVNTVILMQVGAFFEIYGLLKDSSEKHILPSHASEKCSSPTLCSEKNSFGLGDASSTNVISPLEATTSSLSSERSINEKINIEIPNENENIYTNDSEIYQLSNICQLNIAEKKYIFNNKKLVMAGFRDHTLEKYLQKITENGFTAVVFVQEKNEKNTRRIFHSIHSAGTYISYDIDNYTVKTTNIMCIWLDLCNYSSFRCDKSISIQSIPRNSYLASSMSSQVTENWSSSTLRPGETSQISKKIICGISVIDTNTGKSSLFEYQTHFIMNPTTFDELERSISVYQPNEVIIISPFEKKDIQKIIQFSGIQTSVIHTFGINNEQSNCFSGGAFEAKTEFLGTKCREIEKCTQQKYINHILSTFYGEDVFNICSEFNTNIIATQSLCFLLNFIQEHNPNLVKSIKLPDFNNTTDRMILANHTLKQLNIINDGETLNSTSISSFIRTDKSIKPGKLSSLLTFLNNCCSPMGKRKFKEQLLNPTFNEDWLNQEYKTTELFLNKYLHLLDPIRKHLSQIKDIEKICRQLVIQKIYPSSIYYLYHSLINIQKIILLFPSSNLSSRDTANWSSPTLCSGEPLNISTFQSETKHEKDIFEVEREQTLKYIFNVTSLIQKTLNIENCKDIYSVHTFEQNIICEGVSNVLDLYYKKQSDNINTISAIRDYLNNLLIQYLSETNGSQQLNENYIKLHETEKMGFSFQITKKRGVLLKSCLNKLDKPFIVVTTFSSNQTGSMAQNVSENHLEIGTSLNVRRTESRNIDKDDVAPSFCEEQNRGDGEFIETKGREIQIFIKDIKFSNATTSNDEIEIPIISKLCRELQTLKDKINKEIQSTYIQFINNLSSTRISVIGDGEFSEMESRKNNKFSEGVAEAKDKLIKEVFNLPSQSTANWRSNTPSSGESLKTPRELIEDIACFAAKIDVMQNKSYVANKYNYCKPTILTDPVEVSPKPSINRFDGGAAKVKDEFLGTKCRENHLSGQSVEKATKKSFVNAVGLRHPLIEHIQQNEIYVPNNLSLNIFDECAAEVKNEFNKTKFKENGLEETNDLSEKNLEGSLNCKGILLYGINTSGKTSLIRALGISVIMAQAGMYVPCKEFSYKPYTAIYSRILGNDNLFKGLSTFAVEMSELRTILKSADNRSLVVGDELCSGTEIQSAISIFISGLIELYNKNCSFIFATHLHEIVNYEEIVEMKYLKIKHLSIHYDTSLECIVYDRILKNGSGSSNYGLTVCQSLFMPDSFMKTAYNIRAKYFPETSGELSYKTTRYNSRKIKGKCEICKIHIADEIHHLREQNESDEKGFIDGFHKNHPANLSGLCEGCHLKMHGKSSSTNEKKVRKKTTKGYKLI